MSTGINPLHALYKLNCTIALTFWISCRNLSLEKTITVLTKSTIQYTVLNISITFLAFRYPRKLIKHLRDERNLEVAISFLRIYYINKETFKIQIIVISKLSPEEYLYKIFKPIDYCQSQNERRIIYGM